MTADEIGLSEIAVISTHILTKRMTKFRLQSNQSHHISTHILTKRMTAEHNIFCYSVRYFNSHPHEEDDALAVEFENEERLFQLTSSRRG